MAASYPAAVKTFTTKTNKVDLVDASHINDIQNEVSAIETELGTDVAGSAATLKARLTISLSDAGGIQGGSSFPGSPTARQLFYRTDLEILYVRDDDNTAWTSLGGSLSNFVCGWSGRYIAAGTGAHVDLLNAQTGLTGEAVTADGMHYWATEYTTITGDNAIIGTFKFKKLASVNTLTFYAVIWTAGVSTATARLKVNTLTADVTSSSATPAFQTVDLDVSSLTNDNIYDLTIRLASSSSSAEAYLGAYTVLAKS